MTAPQQTPAGWYADPNMVDTQRYWDGVQWSDQVRPMIDAPVLEPAYQAPPPPGPVLIRKNTKAGRWGAGIMLSMIGLVVLLPIVGLALLLFAFSSAGESFDTAADEAADEIVASILTDEAMTATNAQYQFGQQAEVVLPSREGTGEDVWLITVSEPVDVTTSVLDDNPAVTTPDDLGYLAFEVEVELLATTDQNSAWFDMVVVGGATGIEYWDAEPTAPCGRRPEEFVGLLPIGPGEKLTGRICLPVRVADIGHPDTRVGLANPGEWVVFGQ